MSFLLYYTDPSVLGRTPSIALRPPSDKKRMERKGRTCSAYVLYKMPDSSPKPHRATQESPCSAGVWRSVLLWIES
jgi:hypothetical protein